MVAFELAVQDAHGLAVAARPGVDRIELCSALPLGGVTPSLGFIEAAVATPGIPPVHVLVRPRPGGFDYSPDEVATTLSDVRHALAAGASGVVIGGVRDGRVDAELVSRVVETGADVTFHRAFDALADPAEAIDDLVKLGVRRILTSAGASRVADALPALARLVSTAADRIEIMAGGGVRPDVIAAIVQTGVPAVHASAKRTLPGTGGVSLGTADAGRETTDEAEAARIIAEIQSARQ
ncbi:copper homeostasis protein CutC [Paractinoplanes lichenicola]|uniref:PF03932 family protein CutC n=1 Tax=Paractinoplanes lichenicola TaxID=2802976 RepID=A0ABS1VYM8_9ACTN|nr:copper homeostasis protein CutC [Actinoplanes lichenicola]MBL7259592.1 copper homeostasis protein CutC [Actinoplanes lichenicola]